MSILLINSDSLHIPLADKSVQCVVTSPPYYGLRDYGIDGQIGLEPTPEEYVANLVAVFREVRRVLRDDGTCWMNLGDSYWGGKGKSGYELPDEAEARRGLGETFQTAHNIPGYMDMRPQDGKHETIKPKDLVGIPWRVAFALQADGWWLRSDIIWHKPNPMPESVTDRPTKAHEYVFLLTKQARYYFDQDAVKEQAVNGDPRQPLGSVGVIGNPNERRRQGGNFSRKYAEEQLNHGSMRLDRPEDKGTRNIRTVWTIPTQPTPFAHFATYPEKLVEPCIKAGSRENDVVLDPFAGSGTTGIVSRRLGRHFVGLDLSLTYLQTIARRRLELDRLDAWSNGIQAGDDGWHDLPMFQEAQP